MVISSVLAVDTGQASINTLIALVYVAYDCLWSVLSPPTSTLLGYLATISILYCLLERMTLKMAFNLAG